VRSDLKGRGLGWRLMEMMIEYARKEGLTRVHGQVLWENSGMIRMCRELGFELKPDPEDPTLSLVSLALTQPAAAQGTAPERLRATS
jgi:acetyltransferase